MLGVELSDRNVSAKLLKSLTVLYFQKDGKRKAKTWETIRIAGPATLYVPGASAAAGHREQKMLAGQTCSRLSIPT